MMLQRGYSKPISLSRCPRPPLGQMELKALNEPYLETNMKNYSLYILLNITLMRHLKIIQIIFLVGADIMQVA